MGLIGKILSFTFLHANQADKPVISSSAAFKAGMDSQAVQLQTAVNSLYDQLNSVIPGSSGAELTGSAPISGVSGATPYAQIVDLKNQMVGLTLGQIPDNTITTPKLVTDIQQKLNQILPMEREIATLKARQDAIDLLHSRADGASGYFYDLNDGTNVGSIAKLDATSTNVVGAVSIGTQTVTVKSVTGFVVGQEVTLMDDVNLERPVIQSINTGTKQITFTATLTKAFKDLSQLCRSSVVQDNVNRLMKFGGWSIYSTYTITSPTTVVATGNDTSGNNGKKIIYLPSGETVSISINAGTIYITKLNSQGLSPVQLATISAMQVGAAIACSGYTCTIVCNDTTKVYSVTFDARTVTNIDLNSTKVTIDTLTSVNNNMSVTIGSDGIPQASWSGVFSSTPNSKNVMYTKATSTAVAAWAAPIRVTTENTASTNYTNPCVIDKGGVPYIVFEYSDPSNKAIGLLSTASIGTSFSAVVAGWKSKTVIPFGTPAQSSPSIYVKQKGLSVGRLIIRWHGLDLTDNLKQNEKWAYSDDGGVTLSAVVKITTGNTIDRQKGVLCEDNSGNLYDVYMDGAGISYQMLPNGSTTWGSSTSLDAAGTNPSVIEQLDFAVPVTLYMSASTVKLKGTWSSATSTPVLVEDARYNITPASNISSCVAWVDRETDAGLSLVASFSIHSSTENFVSMTKTTATLDGTTSEDQFTGSAAANSKATLRVTLNRTSTSINKSVKQITGAVGT